jgi:hypothetical protein
VTVAITVRYYCGCIERLVALQLSSRVYRASNSRSAMHAVYMYCRACGVDICCWMPVTALLLKQLFQLQQLVLQLAMAYLCYCLC